MRRNVKNVIITLLMVVMYFVIVTLPAMAEELPITKVKLSVSLEGTLPTEAEKFTFNLKADNIKNPMPEDTINEVYSMTLAGEETTSFPEIIFSNVGVYNYTIWQEEGKNADCTYDNSIYNLIVYVTNKENGEGLEATSVLYKDNESEKLDEAKFHNIYKTITPIKEDVMSITDIVQEKPVNTGDQSNIIFWVILSSIGAIGILYIILSANKKSEKN
ncbi:MAG: hypothetical protein HUJ77_04380 [Clostridium sp.]|mgnify:FL=1|uniref:Spy0128 family protein n=1 Tax=Clostridium sp. TaxID=1506 RepID=UPI0025BC22ED|nr:FctA domain-containing protein [Clostridium sp.]MCF0147617.1 hypothetical protein [Clostridium sp.]